LDLPNILIRNDWNQRHSKVLFVKWKPPPKDKTTRNDRVHRSSFRIYEEVHDSSFPSGYDELHAARAREVFASNCQIFDGAVHEPPRVVVVADTHTAFPNSHNGH
jgi:hypothetical protein